MLTCVTVTGKNFVVLTKSCVSPALAAGYLESWMQDIKSVVQISLLFIAPGLRACISSRFLTALCILPNVVTFLQPLSVATVHRAPVSHLMPPPWISAHLWMILYHSSSRLAHLGCYRRRVTGCCVEKFWYVGYTEVPLYKIMFELCKGGGRAKR